MQTEMFDEFPHDDKNNQSKYSFLFNIKFLKGIKIELSFDIIIILGIIFILFCISSYFIGIQKGKTFIPKNVQAQVNPPVAVSAPVSILIPTPASAVPVTAPVAEKKAALVKVTEEYKYTIQIGASRDKNAAIKDVTKLKDKGYDAFISISQSASGKNWYKICVGKFAKSKDSSKIKNDLKFKERYNDSFLTRL